MYEIDKNYYVVSTRDILHTRINVLTRGKHCIFIKNQFTFQVTRT